MNLDKVLQKLQSQILQTVESLENFTNETIQPTVDECEELQKYLIDIQESLAVYKYIKLDKEISPSFNIHSKISELSPPNPTPPLQAEIEKPVQVSEDSTTNLIEDLSEAALESIKLEHKVAIKPLVFAINDKFRFINELFQHNTAEYNVVIEQIQSLNNWQECEIYLNSLIGLYQWKEQSETVKHFYTLIKKRYD